MKEYHPEDWPCGPCEENEDGHLVHPPHIEGSKFHVLHWDSIGRHCSEPNCEVNFEREGNR